MYLPVYIAILYTCQWFGSGNLVLPSFMIKFKHILLRYQMDCVTGKAYVNPLQITKSRSEVKGFISYAFI